MPGVVGDGSPVAYGRAVFRKVRWAGAGSGDRMADAAADVLVVPRGGPWRGTESAARRPGAPAATRGLSSAPYARSACGTAVTLVPTRIASTVARSQGVTGQDWHFVRGPAFRMAP